MGERFSFQQDDDGHWYLVPANDVKRFNSLIYNGWESWTEDDEAWISNFYLDYHPSCYSFTSIEEIK